MRLRVLSPPVKRATWKSSHAGSGLVELCRSCAQNRALNRFAVGMVLIALAAFNVLAQPTSWRTEHRDSLLVAPFATDVQYKGGPGFPEEEITYTVEDPYPATDVLAFIHEDLKQKNWKPLADYPGLKNAPTSEVNGWTRFGFLDDHKGDPPAEYQWVGLWENEKHERVGYVLRYTNSKEEHYLRTLHVQAAFLSAEAAARWAARKKPDQLRSWLVWDKIWDHIHELGPEVFESWDISLLISFLAISVTWIGGPLLFWAWRSHKSGTPRTSLYTFTASVLLYIIPMVPMTDTFAGWHHFDDWMAWHHLSWRFISLAVISLSFVLLTSAVVLSWRCPGQAKIGTSILFVVTLPLFGGLIYEICNIYTIPFWLQHCIHDSHCRYL